MFLRSLSTVFQSFFSKGWLIGELLFLGNSKGPPIDLVFPKVFTFHEFILRNFEIMQNRRLNKYGGRSMEMRKYVNIDSEGDLFMGIGECRVHREIEALRGKNWLKPTLFRMVF